jgi:hypothetical protein
VYQGKVGVDPTLEQGSEAARMVALSALAAIKAEIGSLDRIVRIVELLGWVNSAPGFTGCIADALVKFTISGHFLKQRISSDLAKPSITLALLLATD